MFQQCQNISSSFFAKIHHSNTSKEKILTSCLRTGIMPPSHPNSETLRHKRSCNTFCMTKNRQKGWKMDLIWASHLPSNSDFCNYLFSLCLRCDLKSLPCFRDKLIIAYYQSKWVTESIDSLKIISSVHHIFFKFGVIHWQNLTSRQVSGAKHAPEVHSWQLLVHFNKSTLETLTSTEKLTSISQSRRTVLILGCSWGCLCK